MIGVKALRVVVLLQFFLLVKGTFVCENGFLIDKNNLCDGKGDCEDNSDETDDICFHLICPKNKFRCQYGGCIDVASRCNGTVECMDGSDEKYCYLENKCSENQFQCFNDGRCIDENLICDGNRDCSDHSDESKILCESHKCPVDTFRCQHGGCIYNDLLCNGFKDCADGSDETPGVCDYVRCKGDHNCLNESITCKPVVSKGVHTTCISNYFGHIPCNKSIPVGSKAEFECQDYYQPNKNHDAVLNCQPDGKWNGRIPKCTPDCGKLYPAAEPMITYGRNITYWPWHATMYIFQNGGWVSACGGTLVSENIVLTAAHCTWRKSPLHIKFAFSKYHADYNIEDEYTQIRSVEKIVVPPEYRDVQSNYGSDIAVVFLSEPVVLSEYVRPACLDWDLSNIDQHLSENQTGTIAGVGLTEDNNPSQVLKALDLPVISASRCIKNQQRDFKKYITYTTFCAGWANGTGVCNGDSGGGLLFRDVKDSNRWILQGLVSVSPRRKKDKLCDTFHYAVFTKVGIYIDWLKNVMKDKLF